jgi:hypothetical protein
MLLFWQLFVWGRTNLFLLCYIEYYFYLFLCVVDKLVAIEDEERKITFGFLAEPGWFIKPVSEFSYDYFLKFKGILIMPTQYHYHTLNKGVKS